MLPLQLIACRMDTPGLFLLAMEPTVFTVSDRTLFLVAYLPALILFLWAIVYPFRFYRQTVGPAAGFTFPTRAAFALSLILAAIAFYRSSYHASDLDVTDSVEYAVAGERLYTFGTYDLPIEGKYYPPRYPIGFSLFIGLPAHALTGAEPGNSIHAIHILAVIGAAAAFLTAYTIAGTTGGVLAVLLLIVGPEYRQMSRIIWTDGPAAVLFLLGALLFLVLRREKNPPLASFFAAGALTALGVLFRPTNAAICLPFMILIAQNRKDWFKKLFLLCVLPALAVIAQWIYNFYIFGDFFRTGYHYWVGNYYDYMNHTFNFRGIPACIVHLAERSGFVVLLILCAGIPTIHKLLKKDNYHSFTEKQEFWSLALFTAVVSIPLMLFFLPYYFCWHRFFLPENALMAVVLAAAGGTLLKQKKPELERYFSISLFLLIIGALLIHPYSLDDPTRRIAADRINTHTPDDSVIVSALDPVYLEPLVLRNTSRIAIPISREVEFASKTLTPQKIDNPDPPFTDFRDPFSQGLLNGGAILPVTKVALEDPLFIADLIAADKEVFLETAEMEEEDLEAFRQHFSVTPVYQSLYRVEVMPHCLKNTANREKLCPSQRQAPKSAK